jgi:hypothetical protein
MREADPAKPQILSCPPGYGYVRSLTGTPYANHLSYEGGAMCIPCESGFYSPGGRSRCLSCTSAAASSNAGFITPQGASSAAQCVCAAGFGGPGCKICPVGTFRYFSALAGAAVELFISSLQNNNLQPEVGCLLGPLPRLLGSHALQTAGPSSGTSTLLCSALINGN